MRRLFAEALFPEDGKAEGTIGCKPFGKTQDWDYSLGYIQKDKGSAWYVEKYQGITAQEMEAARLKYNQRKQKYHANTDALSKSNFLYNAFQFPKKHPPELRRTPIGTVIRWMVWSGS
jgi:hypothetical protein